MPRTTPRTYDQIRNVILDVTAVQDQGSREAALANFKEMLEIRKSSLLFRLRTQAQIDQRVRFYNTGPFQIPGVVAMGIDGCTETGLRAGRGRADGDLQRLRRPAHAEPVRRRDLDTAPGAGRFGGRGREDGEARCRRVRRAGAHDGGVLAAPAQTSCAPYPVDMFVRGSFNDWANPPPRTYKLQFLGGTVYAVSALGRHDREPRVQDRRRWLDGRDQLRGGPERTSDVRLGVPITLTCADGTGNLKHRAHRLPGNYTFALNAASTANPVLTVTKTPAFSRADLRPRRRRRLERQRGESHDAAGSMRTCTGP